MTKHKPMMPAEEVEKRRIWSEKVYQDLLKVSQRREIRILDKDITALPGVFAPLWNDSLLLAKTVREETKEGDYVLDLGTGTGVQGIFAAEKAYKVLSADVNPLAVECATLNVAKFGLGSKIRVIQSDLFSSIDDQFDQVIFNPPFRWFKPRDMLERGEVDEDYDTLTRFFGEVRGHLKENGRILLVFADSGDKNYLEHLIQTHRFDSRVLATADYAIHGWKYYAYRLTAQHALE